MNWKKNHKTNFLSIKYSNKSKTNIECVFFYAHERMPESFQQNFNISIVIDTFMKILFLEIIIL